MDIISVVDTVIIRDICYTVFINQNAKIFIWVDVNYDDGCELPFVLKNIVSFCN